MKKISILLVSIFLVFPFVISNSYSKALPPGSGVADVPANVLILLDKSGSMSVSSYTGANIGRTQSIALIGNTGNYISNNNNQLVGVDHGSNARTAIVQKRVTYSVRNNNCSTNYGNTSILHHDGHIYFSGKRTHRSNGTLCRVNTSSGVLTQIKGGFHRNSRLTIKKHNDVIIVIDKHSREIFLYDSATGAKKECSTSGELRNDIHNSGYGNGVRFTVDASGNLVFARSYYIKKFSRSGMNCPNNSKFFQSAYFFDIRNSTAIASHPTNENIIYFTSSSNHALHKVTLNSSSGTNVSFTQERVGRYGRLGGNYNPTSKSAIRFNFPRDITIDPSLNRIFVAETNNFSIQTFDLNLNYHGRSGYRAAQSRMSGAHQAIQSLVTDSSLVSSVNFGFGYWSHDASNTIWYSYYKRNNSYKRCRSYIGNPSWLTASHWLARYNYWCWKPSAGGLGYTKWDTARDQADPCDGQNCLKVKVDRNGANKINNYIKSVRPGGGTDANTWATIAEQYYNHKSESPIDKNSPCQGSYVIVIGDGDWYNQAAAITKTKNLLKKKIKTFTVAYGGGISPGGIRAFNAIAKAGGTDRVIKADTTDQLKAQLGAAIRSVIADKLAFTAPAITATIEEGGSLFQAQFKYKQNEEWQGSLTRTAISKEGVVDEKDPSNWNASDVIPSPGSRKIWGVIPGADYKTDYNNYTEANSLLIQSQLGLFGNEVGDYHRDTPKVAGVTGNTRCSAKGDSVATIADGNDDDVKGLISFSRGQDYFDYDGDCLLNEIRTGPPTVDKNGKIITKGRKRYLGDIFHSEMVIVGAPSAETSFSSSNQEAYWRSINNYDAWAKSLRTREERIYVGGNDGMLHSIDSKTGIEKWAFIPPFIMPKIPLMVNENLNNELAKQKGGTNAIYGVDGSPVVHDMFFKSPLGSGKQWHTILMVPYGRGGNGFSVLDITKPDKPLHLYSVYNDHIKNTVHVMNHLGTHSEYEYIDDTYSIIDMEESITVQDNYNNNNSIDDECKADTTTSCYESKTWTFPVVGVQKSDLIISINNKIEKNFTVNIASSGKTEITLPDQLFFQANGDKAQSQDTLIIKLTRAATQSLSQNLPAEYNYRELGETWSAPRIFRLPNTGAGDTNILDDIYVAVMGGGYGGRNDGVGSALFVINLEDTITPGKVEKVIEVLDDKNIDIVNSIPGSPVVITSDTARGIKFTGALVYTNDFEGKITKFNLTNMKVDAAGSAIKLYDQSTILSIEASKENGRYQYHSMDAGIGKTSKNLWLFSGTGDYERLTFKDTKLDNIMFGFRDKFYPKFHSPQRSTTILHGLEKCMDTTDDTTGVKCPLTTKAVSRKARATKDHGWFIKLPSSQKITAEPTLSNGLVYFPIFEPSVSKNRCSLGLALICAVDDECGTNVSKQLNENKSLKSQTVDGEVFTGKTCKAVGKGVLSRLVVFANKLFANIAGKSEQEKTDLVVIETGESDIDSFRNSWRDVNF